MPDALTPVQSLLLGAAVTLAIQIILVAINSYQERRKWKREGAVRSFPERQRVYLEFLRAWDHHRDALGTYWSYVDDEHNRRGEPDEYWLDDLSRLLLEIEVLGSREMIELTDVSQRILLDYLNNEGDAANVRRYRDALVAQIRKDLNVPHNK